MTSWSCQKWQTRLPLGSAYLLRLAYLLGWVCVPFRTEGLCAFWGVCKFCVPLGTRVWFETNPFEPKGRLVLKDTLVSIGTLVSKGTLASKGTLIRTHPKKVQKIFTSILNNNLCFEQLFKDVCNGEGMLIRKGPDKHPNSGTGHDLERWCSG